MLAMPIGQLLLLLLCTCLIASSQLAAAQEMRQGGLQVLHRLGLILMPIGRCMLSMHGWMKSMAHDGASLARIVLLIALQATIVQAPRSHGRVLPSLWSMLIKLLHSSLCRALCSLIPVGPHTVLGSLRAVQLPVRVRSTALSSCAESLSCSQHG